MKTVTFYSYKGGVGRSLALVNVASRLIEFGKTVCLIDFDLEAPGLNYKFGYDTNSIKKGVVDYIYDFSNKGILNEDILSYCIPIPTQTNSSHARPSFLFPAGNNNSHEYWKKLSAINWYELIYERKDGIAFFLDLKEKIETQLAPDFLLIDSRTGISEVSGVALSLMAEEVVALAANNRENLDGVTKVLKGLVNSQQRQHKEYPSITFVLSRIPFTDKPEDKTKELLLVNNIRDIYLKDFVRDIYVIHSDRELEENESIKIGYDKDDKSMPQISRDYLLLFEKITKNSLSQEEVEKFSRVMKANQLWIRVQNANLPIHQRMSFLDEALELVPDNFLFGAQRIQFYLELNQVNRALEDALLLKERNPQQHFVFIILGEIYLLQRKFDSGTEAYRKALSFFPNSFEAMHGLANVYYQMGQYDQSIEVYQKIFDVGFKNTISYNGMANSLKGKKEYTKALEFVYQALSLAPNSFIALSTLAEIKAGQGIDQEFFLNFELAIIAAIGTPGGKLLLERAISGEDIYTRFEAHPKFCEILKKYDFNYEFSSELDKKSLQTDTYKESK